MELDTNPTKPTKCVRLIRSPTYRELTVLVISLVVVVALVIDQKHLIFVSTNCAPPVVDQIPYL